MREKSKAMQIFIQRNLGDRYWSDGKGWVELQSQATIYSGVVTALDACINHRLGGADILMTFGMQELDLRLRTS